MSFALRVGELCASVQLKAAVSRVFGTVGPVSSFLMRVMMSTILVFKLGEQWRALESNRSKFQDSEVLALMGGRKVVVRFERSWRKKRRSWVTSRFLWATDISVCVKYSVSKETCHKNEI